MIGSACRDHGISSARPAQIRSQHRTTRLSRVDDHRPKRAGLTQQELAKRLKRPQSFVAKYEGGERRLDVVEFITIARAIGADPLRILKSLLNRAG